MNRQIENSPTDEAGRRRFLGGIITTIHTVIGGTLGIVLGGAAVSPGLGRPEESWLVAGSVSDLPRDEPTAVTLHVARSDGYARIVERRTIFLVKSDETRVTALDSTCTHLGCRVSWDRESQALRCPCHGGAYDRTGAVTAGPPPTPLAAIPTRIDGDQVLVRV